MVQCLMAVALAAELGLQARRNYTSQDSEACQGIADAPTVTDELRRLEGEMSRLRRLVGNLLDMVEDGGGQEVKERLKAREGELARLQTQYAELQQRQKLAAFELSDAELEAVLAAMRADVQSAEVAVARRALSLFVRVVDAERLVIWYHEPALVENARLQCVPPRGFVFCASITC
jgi:predicted nuclease with TOPRIM domain